MKVEIGLIQITHFPKDDPDCDGDYYDIELRDENNDKIVGYGDHYHDSGQEKMEGFIQGFRHVLEAVIDKVGGNSTLDILIEYRDVADRDG